MKQLFILSVFLVATSPTPAEALNIKIKGVDIAIGKKGSAPAKEDVHSCTVEAFGQKFFGEAPTEGQAKRKAMEECQKKYHGMHCEVEACAKG